MIDKPTVSEPMRGRLMRGLGLILAVMASGRTAPDDETDADLFDRARRFVAFIRGRL